VLVHRLFSAEREPVIKIVQPALLSTDVDGKGGGGSARDG
jgi:hypothetical protein